MALIYLVRHGEPAAHWGGADPDPGLSRLGQAQAAHAAATLRGLAPVALTSPLRRCVETAGAFAMETGVAPELCEDVREVPTPADIPDRSAWLQGVMAGRWSEAPALAAFRRQVIGRLLSLEGDTVVFSHYVAINAAAGAALDRDDVMVFRPAHASVTTLSNAGGRLSVVVLGAETPAVNAL